MYCTMGMRHLLLFMVSDTSGKITMMKKKKNKLSLEGKNNVLFTSLKLLNLGSLFLISPVTYFGLTRHGKRRQKAKICLLITAFDY